MGKPNTKSISRYFGRTFHTSTHICTVQPYSRPWYLLFVAACHSFSHSMDNSYSFAALFDNLYLLSYFAVSVWRYRYPTSDYRARVNLDNMDTGIDIIGSKIPLAGIRWCALPCHSQPVADSSLRRESASSVCVSSSLLSRISYVHLAAESGSMIHVAENMIMLALRALHRHQPRPLLKKALFVWVRRYVGMAPIPNLDST